MSPSLALYTPFREADGTQYSISPLVSSVL